MSKLALAFADGAVVAKRNLIKIRRVPEILIWTTMSPIMFVLLFGLVFGSSIVIPGVSAPNADSRVSLFCCSKRSASARFLSTLIARIVRPA